MPQLVVLGLYCCCLSAAPAAGVYQWTDEAGKVHFGDRPPPGAASRKLGESAQSVPAPAGDDAQRRQRQQRLLELYEEERQERKAAAAQERRRAEQRRENCRIARAQLREWERANFAYDYDASGQRRILPDEARERSLGLARDAVARWCDEP